MSNPLKLLFSFFKRKSTDVLSDNKTIRQNIGKAGEDAAAKQLKKENIKILEQNYRALGHEIDIIARDKNEIVFCEVKTRTLSKNHNENFISRPAEAITPKQIKNISIAAKAYLSGLKTSCRCRFDIIEVYVEAYDSNQVEVVKIKHIKDGFRL